jgi:CRISPR-associated protein Csx3
MVLSYSVDKNEDYVILNIHGDNISPTELVRDAVPDIMGTGVVLSGRSPVWVFSFLTHVLGNKCRWVATYDPRIIDGGGAVVVATGSRDYTIGDIIKVSLPK